MNIIEHSSIVSSKVKNIVKVVSKKVFMIVCRITRNITRTAKTADFAPVLKVLRKN